MRSIYQIFLLVICYAGFLSQCSAPSPLETAGGDDFPNMIAKSGESISGNLANTWVNPAVAEMEPLSIVNIPIPSTGSITSGVSKRMILPKRALTDSTAIMFDTSNGNFIFTHKKSTVVKITCDTIIFRVKENDTAIVSISGSTQPASPLLPSEYYKLSDSDGDSLLVSPSAPHQKARAYFKTTGALNTETIQLVEVDAGEDGDFGDSSDNALISATTLVLRQGDTLTWSHLTDADGDGFLVTASSALDSSIVDITVRHFETASLALIRKTVTSARMVIFTSDSTRNYAIRYTVINEFDTRTVTWNIQKTNGDSTFLPGDTVNIRRTTFGHEDNTLAPDTLLVKSILGTTPTDSADDALLSIYTHVQFNSRSEKDLIFDFSATPPVFSGEAVKGGTFRYSVQVRDSVWYRISGMLDEARITAEAVTSTGITYTVIWNRDGSLVSIRKLD